MALIHPYERLYYRDYVSPKARKYYPRERKPELDFRKQQSVEELQAKIENLVGEIATLRRTAEKKVKLEPPPPNRGTRLCRHFLRVLPVIASTEIVATFVMEVL